MTTKKGTKQQHPAAPTHYEGVCEDCGIEVILTAAQADRFISTHVDAKHLATVQPREAK